MRYLLLLCLLTLVGCESLFFYPEKTLTYHPDLISHKPVDYMFPSTDNTTLHGWYFSPPANEKPKGTILFLHGNGQNMSYHIHTVWWLVNAGYAVFTFDYRGYGVSTGEPSIKGVMDDSHTALDLLLSGNIPDVDDVIVLGQSMGGAIAIYTVATTEHQDRISALITDSAFSSWRDIAREKAGDLFITWAFQYPVAWTINDDYAPRKFISEIDDTVNIMLIHNRKDPIIPYEHAEVLYKSSGKRADLLITNYEGHVTAGKYNDTQQKVINFLDIP